MGSYNTLKSLLNGCIRTEDAIEFFSKDNRIGTVHTIFRFKIVKINRNSRRIS